MAKYVDGDSKSKRDALLHVLQWVWGRHEAVKGEKCPFYLEA